MIDISLPFWALLADKLATFGIHLVASETHQKLRYFLNSRNLSNYDLLECLRKAYDEALNSLWDDYSPIEEPENVLKEKMQEYLQRARIDRDKAEECLQRLKQCKDQVFPSPGKGIKKTPFTDKEIRHLVTNANGEEERERIMGIISPVLDVCGAPETFKNLVEDLEVGLCFRIIFYLKGKIKTDGKVRSILFFELLIDLGCTQEQIRQSVEEIKNYISGQGLPIWTDLNERLKQLEFTVRGEGEKTRKHADERIGIAEEKIIKEVRKVARYEFESPLYDFFIENQLDFKNRNGFEPKFFRPMGPVAVDFGDDRVASRDDIVPKLIDNLKKRNLVIAGEPACGKSIILRWVGYLLFCENNSNIFYIPLKERRHPEIERIRTLQEFAYLLIDDGHLDPDFVRDILHPPSENVRVLVATRLQHKPPEMETSLPGRLKDWQDEAITIKPVNAIDAIIHTFESHPENNLTIPKDIKAQMEEEYCVNLWLLSWALETYRAKESIQETDILERVKEWLVSDYQDGLRSEDRDKIRHFARIALLLSIFYQYEVPVDREFVSKFLAKVNNCSEEQSEAQIEILLRNCTIAGDETFIALHHSELAKMLLKAAREFPNERPYRNILRYLQPKKLFSGYLKDFPRYGCNLLSQIPLWEGENKSLIVSLTAKNKEIILEAIRQAKDVEIIGRCVGNIAEASEDLAGKIVETYAFDRQGLIGKLNEESDVEKIGLCVRMISKASEEVAGKIVQADAFDKDGLIQKLSKERDVVNIGWCMRSIVVASEEVAMKLVPAVSKRLNEENDVKKVGGCVCTIAHASEEIAMKLVPVVAEKLNGERDFEKIGRCIEDIAVGSEDVAMKLIPVVADRLNVERDIREIGWRVSRLVTAERELARKIVTADNFNKDGLIQKLNDETDIQKIGECVRDIATASKEFARSIVTADAFDKQGLIQKLNDERDLWRIGECVRDIATASEEVARNIVTADGFDKQGLIQKLNDERDVWRIEKFVGHIATASKEFARKIVTADGFNKEGFIQKLNEEKDLHKIKWCMSGIAEVSKEFARGIVTADGFNKEGLIQKLNDEWDLSIIGACVGQIAAASKEFARSIVTADAFDKQGLIQKLNDERDLWRIGACVGHIAAASKEFARSIVTADAFDKQGLIQKLNDETDIQKIGECVRDITVASKGVGRKIVRGLRLEVQALIKK